MADAPAIIATATSYGQLIDGLRGRADSLGISRETIDEIAGLPSGLASKVLGPIPQRRMGPTTLPLILGALGLRIGLIEDAEALRRISSRLVPRHEKSAHGRVPRLETISAELREGLMAAARAELERKAETRRRRSPRNGRNGRRAA